MTPEQQAKLRAPFDAAQIGKLPRVTCKDCSDKRRDCTRHQAQWCRECSNTISTQHIHLDYVGHADVTDRLLDVDPEWGWEPMARTDRGLPQFDEIGGLWIVLTIAGTSRIGYGDAEGKDGADAVKGTIGNAIRNGAMRFGVALDLWKKNRAKVAAATQTDDGESWDTAEPRQAPQLLVTNATGEKLLMLLDQSGRNSAERAFPYINQIISPAVITGFSQLTEDQAILVTTQLQGELKSIGGQAQ